MVTEQAAAPAHTAGDGSPQPDVRLAGVRKRFGEVAAVDGVDVDIARGEFFTLLGPSGSGKTTTLRLIAGFEWPASGAIELDGVDVTNRPPYQRDVNTVFQDYALFPHMRVLDNVAYGLKVKRVPKRQARQRAEEALELVGLAGLGGRRPIALSGGQRQRVALARALVNRPRVLLLDEPLGALDLKLREQMQAELSRIQRELAGAVTFLYVTHDQDEALRLSDRLAVMVNGRIEQVGTPAEVYEHPATEFVAGFVGTSNILQLDGKRYTIRPEKLTMLGEHESAPDAMQSADGVIREVIYLGAVTRYVIERDDGTTLTALRQNLKDTAQEALAQRGRRVRVAWREEQLAPVAADSDKEVDSR